jgi:hypothetical protein
MRVRLVSRLGAALVAVPLLVAGCGGGGGGTTEPATVVPPGSPLVIEGTIQPEGKLKTDLEAVVERVAGISDLGGKIVSELEQSAAGSGGKLDFATEIEPWLGQKAALGFQRYDGHNFTGFVVGLQTTDAGAAEEFLAKEEKEGQGGKQGSYEGVDFWVGQATGYAVGVTDGLLVLAESEAAFKRAIDAAKGESVADQERFTAAMAAAPSGSLADVYVDVGGLIKQAGGAISSEEELFFEFAGIEPREATAVASVTPGSDQVEIDVSTDLAGKQPPSGDASKLLGSMPAGSTVALVAPEYGRVLGEGIDQIDAEGIPGQVPPHQFKKVLGEAGIDVEAIANSIGDIGAFAEGVSESTLGGAVLLETKGASEAKNTVANIGLLLRASGTAGVTAVSGKVSGFSVRGAGIGGKPIVVAAGGNRIAIANGLPSPVKALAAEAGPELAETAGFKAAVAALGSTPISGFAAGPAALRLASSLIGPDQGFSEAKPYLGKIAWLALGSTSSGELATAKLIVGLGE